MPLQESFFGCKVTSKFGFVKFYHRHHLQYLHNWRHEKFTIHEALKIYFVSIIIIIMIIFFLQPKHFTGSLWSLRIPLAKKRGNISLTSFSMKAHTLSIAVSFRRATVICFSFRFIQLLILCLKKSICRQSQYFVVLKYKHVLSILHYCKIIWLPSTLQNTIIVMKMCA